MKATSPGSARSKEPKPENQNVEPWLRGTLQDVPPLVRGVLHALELAAEDLDKWCRQLTDAELHARPAGVAPVAFHFHHIVRSLDRLLTYAEGRQLQAEQLGALKAEMERDGTGEDLFAELHSGLQRTGQRVFALATQNLYEPRAVGKKALPTTLGGLLVHCADHTQRHVGQAITTAKIVLAARNQ
jgi:uncharacterized damage-inducible protein DinB